VAFKFISRSYLGVGQPVEKSTGLSAPFNLRASCEWNQIWCEAKANCCRSREKEKKGTNDGQRNENCVQSGEPKKEAGSPPM